MAKYLDLDGLRTFWSKIKISVGTSLGKTESSTSIDLSLKNGAASPSSLSSVTLGSATTSAAGLMSASDKSKLNGIASGAEVNVQSDWNVTDSTSDAFIKNKPNIPAGVVVDDTMSDTSTNAIQNKAVKAYVDGKEIKIAAGSNVQIEDGTGSQAGYKIISATDTTYSSKAAASGGTEVSLVTTGDKYTWNNKQNAITFNTAYNASTNKAATMSDINAALTSVARYQGTIASETAFTALANYKTGYYWIASATFVHATADATITIDSGDMIISKNDRASYSASDFDVVSTDIDSIPDSEIEALT